MSAYWWCPNCKQKCGGRSVTYEEYHQACGHRVESVQPGDPLDILHRDNERLRAALAHYASDEYADGWIAIAALTAGRTL